MSIFNNPDFYPTPDDLIGLMLSNTSIEGKVVLEPSAGIGSIVDYIKNFSPKEVIVCEKDKDLIPIVSEKADRFISEDFLTVSKSEISHIDAIIANPPFSNADEHILHMWEVAPDGCEIISLCNWETVNNSYSRKRSKLNSIIEANGSKENLGDVFSSADRKTDVNVGIIKLYKPRTGESEFDGYFDLEEEQECLQSGIIQHNEIVELVNRYVGAVKYYDIVFEHQERMNDLVSPISHFKHKIEFIARFSDSNKNYSNVDRETFKKELQKGAWKNIFEKFDMERFVTEKIMAKLNNFVEKQSHVPFTVKNVYKMIEMVVGTHSSTMKDVIIEVFDWLTSHHSENRMQLEGWKTNSEYIVNKKFIAPYCGVGINMNGHPEIKYGANKNIDDLYKALCWLTGVKYKKENSMEVFFHWCGEKVEYEKLSIDAERKEGYSYIEDIRTWTSGFNERHEIKDLYEFKEEPNYIYSLSNGYNKGIIRHKLFGKWYNWGFFKVRVYKKGTMHCEFKDENVWEMFNREAAKAKGFQLASKFRSNYKQKSNEVEVYV